MKKNLTLLLLCCACILSAQTFVPTTTLMPWNSTWKWKNNSTDLGTGWYASGYNDAAFSSGPAPLGYGNVDAGYFGLVIPAQPVATTIGSPGAASGTSSASFYLRSTFTLSTSSYSIVQFKLRVDDGCAIYLNGQMISTTMTKYATASSTNSTVATSAVALPFQMTAPWTYTSMTSAQTTDGQDMFTFTLSATSTLLVNGTNTIAVEVHNRSNDSSDMLWAMQVEGGNMGSAPPVAVNIVKGPYLQVGTQSSMIIRWETNVASDTKLMYGTNAAALSSVVTNTALETSHEVSLTGLTPYTKYFYSIGMATVTLQGDADNYFQTSPVPGAEGKYRFWVIGDCGNASTNQVNVKNQYKNYNGSRVTDGWLTLGDNAYSNGSDPQFNAEFFSIYQNDVMKNKVLWPVPGNHDYNNGAVTSSTTPYFSIFNVPTAAQAGGVASGTKAYYSYDYGNIHFIALDSYGTVAGNKMYDTTGAQAVWLKADLAANTKKWTIAYWHHPPYTMGSHNSDTEGDLVAIRQRFIRILERNKVDLILCGHSHDYERSKLMKGHYGNEASFNAATHNLSQSSGLYDASANSCPYTKDSVINKSGTVYVLSGSSGQLGGQQGSFPHNAMYFSDASHGGSLILDIEGNRLDAKWLCADGVIRDNFTIYKDVNAVKDFTVQPAQATTLTASWPGNYVWDNAASTRTTVVSAVADTKYWVKDPNSCVADTFRLKVLPAVSFSATTPYCAQTPIQFSDLSTNSTTAWSWSVTPSAGVVISSAASKDPMITFSTAGDYTVTLIADNAYGAGMAYSQTVLVNAMPTVSAALSASAICVNQSASITASGAGTYSWSTGSSSASLSVNPSATTAYTVTGTDANGCQAAVTKTLIVNALPMLTVTSSPASGSVCAGSTLSLNGAGASTYTWTGGVTNGTTFTLNATTAYTVTGTDANGCEGTATKTLVANASPILTITANPANATICQGASLSLSAAGANTFTWTGGVTNGSSFVPASSAVYTVSATDAFGCQATGMQSVTVNSLPTVAVTGNTAVCIGNTLTLTAGGAATYSWNTASTGTAISVSPLSNASYTVTGTAANGCQNTAVKNVTVNALPVIAITSSPASGSVCAGSTVSLNGTGASAYVWTGGVTNGAAFTLNATAAYTVTGTDINGCQGTATKTLVANASPVLTVTANPANVTVCQGASLSLSAAGANTFTWTGGITNGSSFAPASSAVYTVTATDASGCQGIATQSVTVNSLPAVAVTGNTAVCIGSTITLTAGGAATYSWNTASTGTAISVSPSSNISYTVTGTAANGCQNMAVKNVTVNALPAITVTANPASAIVCTGSTLALAGSGASTYTWSGGVTNNMPFTVSANATYTVTGTDINGCQNTAVKPVSVNALPAVTISGNATVCAGQTATLTANGAATYSWSNGTASATLEIAPLAGYNYLVVGTDANGCKNTATTNFMVNPMPNVTAVTNNTMICAGQSATLLAAGADTYVWTGNGTGAGIVVTPTASTIYTVNGTTAANCSAMFVITQNVSGCTGIQARTFDESNITVYPNPNNGLFNIEVKEAGSFTVEIVNAIGQTVYAGSLGSGINSLRLDISKGIYFYTVSKESGFINSGKLVIE